MNTGQLVKASFKNLDNNETVEVAFNPTEYQISKTNNWAESPDTGDNVGRLEFTGGNPIELSMTLFFDTTVSGENVQDKYTSKLWSLAQASTPPCSTTTTATPTSTRSPPSPWKV